MAFGCCRNTLRCRSGSCSWNSTGLAEPFRSCSTTEVELTLLLDRVQPVLEHSLDAAQFRLNCAAAINLFPKTCGRLELHGRDVEYHVIPDRNRPQDFEVYSIEKVVGMARSGDETFPIEPFYSVAHRSAADAERAYYTMQRRPRLASTRQGRAGDRTSYLGTECFLSVADTEHRLEDGEAPQADVEALCTNRDLPIYASFGKVEPTSCSIRALQLRQFGSSRVPPRRVPRPRGARVPGA